VHDDFRLERGSSGYTNLGVLGRHYVTSCGMQNYVTSHRKPYMRRISLAIGFGVLAVVTQAYAQDAGSTASRDAGAAVFKKCMACHQVGQDARNGIGPVLNGVVGRPAGTYPGYNYSPATKNSGLVWDESTLTRYLHAPRQVVPGTRMAFAGLTKDREIIDVITYLRQFDAEGKQARLQE
jgi:cytochrome c